MLPSYMKRYTEKNAVESTELVNSAMIGVNFSNSIAIETNHTLF